MTISDLHEKFVFELGAMRDAEERFLEAQQVMLGQASDEQLQMLLREHIGQTQGHIQNLDQAFSLMGISAQSNKCDAANGLVIEGSKTMQMINDPYVRDCAIAGAQAKVEHFEMACYRGLVLSAQMMGSQEVLQLLQQNLHEEETTAQRVEAAMPELLQTAMPGEAAVSGATG